MTKDEKRLLSSFFEILGNYRLDPIIGRALRFLFRNPYESITIVDKDGIVHFMDKSSEEFFGLKQGEAAGIHIANVEPNTNIPLTLSSGKPQIGKIWDVKGMRRIISVYPLKYDGELIGAVGKQIFHSLDAIDRINHQIQRLNKEINYLKQKEKDAQSSVYRFDTILGTSEAIRETVEIAKKIATLDTDVLIVGESGTGKELFAHSIHGFMNADKAFIKVNCSAIPFDLAESQFFGYEKGAFTGANQYGKPGTFEAAEGGTVFLDEISSLPLSIQAKLLRVLQEREVTRLGSTKIKKLKFRSIAATNIDLRTLVKEGKFRQDLYYRVAKAMVIIPPLRERREDIPVYLNYFLKKINQSFKTNIKGFSDKSLEALTEYDWPGNVRELINVLEQTAIKVFDKDRITVEKLPDEVRFFNRIGTPERIETPLAMNIEQRLTTAEKDMIVAALKKTGGNRLKAARLLEMPRSTLYKKLKDYNIS